MSAPALQFSFSEGRVTSTDYFICESTKICYHCILATNCPKNWTCNLFAGNASTAMTHTVHHVKFSESSLKLAEKHQAQNAMTTSLS